MKNLILSLVVFGAMLNPVFAGDHRGGRINGGDRGHFHGDHTRFGGNHERHHGFRGREGRFYGWNGTFYGQIVILDNGCYFWNGYFWVLVDCD